MTTTRQVMDKKVSTMPQLARSVFIPMMDKVSTISCFLDRIVA